MLAKNARKWSALIAAVMLYYVVHEGAHFVYALTAGSFQSIRIVSFGLGVQVVADTTSMSDMHLFLFGIVGFVATLIVGYVLVWKKSFVLQSKSKLMRAIGYYATLVFLCLDPLYLSVLYRFVGGGDFNSIMLIGIPEVAAITFFLALLALNLFLFVRLIYPAYKQRFLEEQT